MISGDVYNQSTPKWPYNLAKFASAIAIIFGAVFMLLWLFYAWLPTTLQDYVDSINLNTAFCFILIGSALWLRCERSYGYAHYLAEICSAAVFLIAMLSLFEYFFDINIGIDKAILSRYSLIQISETRMIPFSATNFILISFVLFFLDSKIIRYQVHQLLTLIVFVNSYFELLAHFFNMQKILDSTHTLPADIFPDLFTTVAFLTLAIGTLFVRPYKGIALLITSNARGGTLARRVIPITLLLPIILGYILQWISKTTNLYNYQLGISLFIVSIVSLFIVVVIIYAFFLNKFDLSKQQAEFALQRSKFQLQSILDQANAIIAIYDLQGRYSLVNKQFEKVFFMSSAEVIGKKPPDVLPKELVEQAVESFKRVIHSRSPVITQKKIPDAAGNIHTYHSNKFPIFDLQGIPSAICSISTDVSEINRIHKKLKDHDERLSLALQSAHAGTWIWDIEQDRFSGDEYLYHLLGVAPKSLAGSYHSIFHFIYPADRRRVNQSIQTALENGTDFDDEFRIAHSDGSIRYLAIRGRIQRNMHGKAIHLAGICWDITQRKHDIKELQKAKHTAESLAKQAEKANRAKSKFLAAMSHEIRTPLNGIIGLTELLLLDKSLTPEQRDSLHTVQLSGQTLLGVINNVLDYSKIESDRIELAAINFDLHQLIRECTAMLIPEAQRKSLEMDKVINSNVPVWFKGDPVKIKQIITNVLGNAVKFTNQGKIHLYVEMLDTKENLGNNEVYLRFMISDTGIGMRPEVVANLFKPFSQADASTSRKYGGTGLGLVISKRLIELMGGVIKVESYPHCGSTFTFTLKLTIGESQSASTSPSTTQQASLPVASTNAKQTRILLVEDNVVNQQVALRMLGLLGYQADSVSSGKEALSKLKVQDYDLIFLDCQMPEMDGYATAKAIRQLESTLGKHIKIIAMTAHALEGEREKCLASGMDDYLSKPISLHTLAEKLTLWGEVLTIPVGDRPAAPDTLLDYERIRLIFGGDTIAMKQFLKTLLTSTNELLEQIQTAIANKDAELTKQLFHRLKGSAANSGMMKIADICNQVEEKLQPGDCDAVQADYETIVALFKQIETELA